MSRFTLHRINAHSTSLKNYHHPHFTDGESELWSVRVTKVPGRNDEQNRERHKSITKYTHQCTALTHTRVTESSGNICHDHRQLETKATKQ